MSCTTIDRKLLVCVCKQHLSEEYATCEAMLVSRITDTLREQTNSTRPDELFRLDVRKLLTTLRGPEVYGLEKKGTLGTGLYWSWHTNTSNDPCVGHDRLRRLQTLIDARAEGGQLPLDCWDAILNPDEILCGKNSGKKKYSDHLITIAGLRADSSNRAQVWRQYIADNPSRFVSSRLSTVRFARGRVLVQWLADRLRCMLRCGAIHGLDPMKTPLLGEAQDSDRAPQPVLSEDKSRVTEKEPAALEPAELGGEGAVPPSHKPCLDFGLQFDMGLKILGSATLLDPKLKGQTKSGKLQHTHELMCAVLVALFKKLRMEYEGAEKDSALG